MQDQSAVNVVLKAIKKVKPNIFIHLGDLCENESVSHWKYKRRKRPPLEYIIPEIDKDIQSGNDGLDDFDKALKEVGCEQKHFIEGNHCDWLNQFVEEHPYLKNYKVDKAYKLKERGYKYYEYGKYLKIGKLYFYHGGHYSTAFHTRVHVQNLGKNVVYGHMHDVQRMGISHVDGTIAGVSLGCLKSIEAENNKWLKGRRTNWNHAFGIVDWFSSGDYILHIVDIIKGKTILNGEVIDGTT